MLYLDLDGVLADFEKKCIEIAGELPNGKYQGRVWSKIARYPNFFGTLDFMPDGKELWEFCKSYNPTILTGVPFGGWASGQKKVWCGKNLGWDVPVITCFSSDKPMYCQPGDILVDDNTRIMEKWRLNKGIFILHTSAAKSIEELKNVA